MSIIPLANNDTLPNIISLKGYWEKHSLFMDYIDLTQSMQ